MKKEHWQEISPLLLSIMKQKGLTQAEVGKRMGLPRQAINRWLTCRKTPGLEAFFKLIEVITEDDLFEKLKHLIVKKC